MSSISKSFTCNFTQVPNNIINDSRVSLKAKGLYLYFVSKPDHWDFSLNGMVSQLKESRTSVLRIIEELCSFGYMDKIKNRIGNKQAVNDYILHAEPRLTPYSSSESRNETHKMRLTKCDSQNDTTSNTNTSNTKKSNTISTYEQRVSFNSFREDFIINMTSKLFTTKGIGFLPDTEFTINSDGLIFNTVNNRILNKEDAFKVWEYLYKENCNE